MKNNAMPADKLWTVNDVMARLSVKRSCATEIIKSLPHIRLNRSLRIDKQVIEDYIQRNYEMPASAQNQRVQVNPKKKKTLPMPGFDENGKLLRRRATA